MRGQHSLSYCFRALFTDSWLASLAHTFQVGVPARRITRWALVMGYVGTRHGADDAVIKETDDFTSCVQLRSSLRLSIQHVYPEAAPTL